MRDDEMSDEEQIRVDFSRLLKLEMTGKIESRDETGNELPRSFERVRHL